MARSDAEYQALLWRSSLRDEEAEELKALTPVSVMRKIKVSPESVTTSMLSAQIPDTYSAAGPRKGFRLYVAFAIATVGVFGAAKIGHQSWLGIYSNLAQVFLPMIAGIVCLVVAARTRRTAHVDRRWASAYWLMLGFGPLCWSAGQSAWTVLDTVLHVQVGQLFVSWPDYGYLGAVAAMTAASLMLRSTSWGLSPIVSLCNGLMIALSLFVVAWISSLQTLLSNGSSLRETIVGPTYPIADVANCSIVLAILVSCTPAVARKLFLVSAGLLIVLAGDLAYLYAQSVDRYQTGSWIDLGWIVGFSFFGLSALSAGTMVRPQRRVEESSLLRMLVPYLALTVPVTALAWLMASGRTPDAMTFSVSISIVAIVILRQLFSSIELRNLYRRREEDRKLRAEITAAMTDSPIQEVLLEASRLERAMTSLRSSDRSYQGTTDVALDDIGLGLRNLLLEIQTMRAQSQEIRALLSNFIVDDVARQPMRESI